MRITIIKAEAIIPDLHDKIENNDFKNTTYNLYNYTTL